MKKPVALSLSIPQPCHENWDNMTPNEKGRFCANCQKTVIDFTKWTDKALFEFFAKQKETVCGRFTDYQLGHEIHLPPQPHSRLYKIFIGLGLTLIFAQIPRSDAKIRPHNTLNFVAPDSSKQQSASSATTDTAGIEGYVLDPKGNPVPGADVQVSQFGINKGGVVSDDEGFFSIKFLPPGVYDVTVKSLEFGSVTTPDVEVKINSSSHTNINLKFTEIRSCVLGGGIVRWHQPLIDSFQSPHTIYRHSQIEQMRR